MTWFGTLAGVVLARKALNNNCVLSMGFNVHNSYGSHVGLPYHPTGLLYDGKISPRGLLYVVSEGD